ncbi:hypothetical protein FJ938_09120 [Mesorhizobium sp. B2-4-14]|nr:hypothetical protein FJ938_09120 [Mesorhizobium sp. B2-4-14]
MNWTPWLPLRAMSGWTRRDLNGDLIAGVTLAAIAIPEQMATARLGGFAAESRNNRTKQYDEPTGTLAEPRCRQ